MQRPNYSFWWVTIPKQTKGSTIKPNTKNYIKKSLKSHKKIVTTYIYAPRKYTSEDARALNILKQYGF